MKPIAAVIIPAAGSGTRMQFGQPKQYHLLAGIPVLARTVGVFLKNSHINRIVVVVPGDRIKQTEKLLAGYKVDGKSLTIIAGGHRRQDSVKAGLESLEENINLILVHDAARPFVSQELINRCYIAALRDGAAIAAIPVQDTLKQGDKTGRISGTIDRTFIWQAQTPQAVQRDLLQRAYLQGEGEDVTDEASLLEKAAIPVRLVTGDKGNIKITYPEDLLTAEKIIHQNKVSNMRIGHGYDAHRFSEGRELVLGGITVSHSHGLAGHSDADVLVHALCDGVLGALCCGDIGKHFPDSDERFAGISSITLLEQVVALVRKKKYSIVNVDITLICQAPHLGLYIPSMQKRLEQTCATRSGTINIKATTTENMGFIGRKEGVSCHAVVLLEPLR